MAQYSPGKASSLGIPAKNMGILHPLLEHRFQIHYRTKLQASDQMYSLTQQTTKFEIDFKNKHIKFEIHQPIAGNMMADVEDLVRNAQGITMYHLDGEGEPIAKTNFTMLECVSHSMVMDYANANQVATHKIVMKYLTVNTKE